MPAPDSTMTWGGALAWFGVIAIASFLVTWVLTDLFKVGRTWYVGLLTVMTGGLTLAYLAWSGTDVLGFVRTHWALGLLGAVLSGGITALGSARMRGAPASGHPHGLVRAEQLLWEDVVYGASEGMLLSVLPVLTVWQALERLGWTTSGAGKIGTGALAVGASLVVIGVHHLGYREFRGRDIVFPFVGCVWFSLAFLLTGSPLSATVGHMGLHAALSVNDKQLPPYEVTGPTAESRPTAMQRA